MNAKLDITGHTYGELTVLGEVQSSRTGSSRWKCLCSCGNETDVLLSHLRAGNTVSCGHRMREVGKSNFKGVGRVPLTYFTEVKRAANGDKGRRKALPFEITIEYISELFESQEYKCKLSKLPLSFNPKTASLDRIDSSLGYVVDNVQWLHKDINMMKRNYNQEYFISLCKSVTDGCVVV